MKDILDNPFIYRLWQAPFNHQKVAPVREYEHLWRGKSVLDIGCGPGINVGLFESASRYVGIDLNEEYVRRAAQKVAGDLSCTFIHHDALESLPINYQPDVLFCSSVLHHFSDEQVDIFFCRLRELTQREVPFLLVDLLLPDERGIPRFLAKADRGDFARGESHWLDLLRGHLGFDQLIPLPIKLGSVVLWKLFFLCGSLKGRH